MFWLLQWWLNQHLQGLALLIFGRPGPASSIYLYMLAPGVVIHELSHWLFAKLLFVRTGDVALFRPGDKRGSKITLGYVEVYNSDPIRQSLIGLAPLPVGIIVLLLLAALLGINHDTISISNWQNLTNLPAQLVVSLHNPLNILWLYMVFAVSNGMLPSSADRRPWLFGFMLPSAILLLLTFTNNLKLNQPVQEAILGFLGTLTWVFAFAAAFNLLLALIIAGLEWVVSKLRRRRIVYRRH